MTLDISTGPWFALRQDADESGTTGRKISDRNSTALGLTAFAFAPSSVLSSAVEFFLPPASRADLCNAASLGAFAAFPCPAANRGKDSERGKWNAWNEAGFQGTPSSCCASQRASWDLRCDGNVKHMRTVPLGNSKRSQRYKEHLLVCDLLSHGQGKAAQGNLKRSVLKRRTDSKLELKLETKTPYWQLLQDPRWQRKRLEILEIWEWRCQCCQATDITLHVHHRYYVPGRMPWEYPNWAFVALCVDCHEMQKTPTREEDGRVRFAGWEWAVETLGLLRIWNSAHRETKRLARLARAQLVNKP